MTQVPVGYSYLVLQSGRQACCLTVSCQMRVESVLCHVKRAVGSGIVCFFGVYITEFISEVLSFLFINDAYYCPYLPILHILWISGPMLWHCISSWRHFLQSDFTSSLCQGFGLANLKYGQNEACIWYSLTCVAIMNSDNEVSTSCRPFTQYD